MRRTLVVVTAALVVLAGGWYAYERGWLGGAPRADGANGTSAPATGKKGGSGGQADGGRVVALGRLEPAGNVINVGTLPGDRLAALKVEEGAHVKRGDELAVLESHALRELDLKLIEAQLAEAQSRRAAEENLANAKIAAAQLALQKVEAQEPEIAAQKAKLELLRATSEQAKRDAARLAELSSDLVSKQERERRALAVQQAEADLQAAQVAYDRLVRTSDLALKGARSDLNSAEAGKQQTLSAIPVGSLSISRDLSKLQLQRSEITSPCDGTILKILSRPGELTGSLPILQMADLSKMVVLCEVYESEVKRIEAGQAATVRSKALPAPFDRDGLRGKVVRVGRMVSAAGLKPIDPLAASDRHVVEVRVELDPDGSRQAARLVHLQVDVTFELR